ncbi:MAG: FAD-dependent oxidoreductase [Candidatus Omnitrophica bacterium]|nr:FAD-dependent oxidoreductase [Candidatus Omnitrophota bacterium]
MPQERSRLVGLKKRVGTFAEVHLGLSKSEAVENARIFLERERAVKGAGCPLTEDFFAVLKLLAVNDVRGAAQKLYASNPLAAVTARLAPEFFVETQVFNRKAARVSLRALERFLADRFSSLVKPDVKTGRYKAAVIGSGPAGLMAAAFLVRQGIAVTVFESAPFLGGSLRCYIPEFRLPAVVLDQLLARLSADGVEFRTNVLFPRALSAEDLFEEGGFSAVLLTAGAGVAEMLGLADENAAGVMAAAEMLSLTRAMHAGQEPYTTPGFLGNRVVVVGHNEMAFDAARTAIRQGRQVTIVVAGAESDIKVPADMVREAAEEGLKFKTFAAPVSLSLDSSGCVKGLVCRHLDYRIDGAGRLTVVEEADAEFVLEAETVLVARGMKANTLFVSEIPGLDLNLDGSVWVKPDSSYTSARKIFAAGHLVRPGASLLDVLLDARRAASEVAAYLKG